MLLVFAMQMSHKGLGCTLKMMGAISFLKEQAWKIRLSRQAAASNGKIYDVNKYRQVFGYLCQASVMTMVCKCSKRCGGFCSWQSTEGTQLKKAIIDQRKSSQGLAVQ